MAPANGRLLFVAGQVASNATGLIAPVGFVKQFHVALKNVIAVVEEADGCAEDICRLTIYIKNKHDFHKNLKSLGKRYRDLMGYHFPAIAMIEVSGFVADNAVLEIEATAVLPSVEENKITGASLWIRMAKCYSLIEADARALSADVGLTLPQFDVLAQLLRCGRPMQAYDLSRELLVTKGNLTGIIDRLENKGLIALKPKPGDGRAKLIELTAKGRRIAKKEVTKNENRLGEIFSALSAKEKTAIMLMLNQLRVTLEGN